MLFAQNYLHKDSSKRHKLKKINTTVVLTRKIMCMYNVDFVLCLVIIYTWIVNGDLFSLHFICKKTERVAE